MIPILVVVDRADLRGGRGDRPVLRREPTADGHRQLIHRVRRAWRSAGRSRGLHLRCRGRGRFDHRAQPAGRDHRGTARDDRPRRWHTSPPGDPEGRSRRDRTDRGRQRLPRRRSSTSIRSSSSRTGRSSAGNTSATRDPPTTSKATRWSSRSASSSRVSATGSSRHVKRPGWRWCRSSRSCSPPGSSPGVVLAEPRPAGHTKAPEGTGGDLRSTGPAATNKSAVPSRRRVPRSPALRPANLVPGTVPRITPEPVWRFNLPLRARRNVRARPTPRQRACPRSCNALPESYPRT